MAMDEDAITKISPDEKTFLVEKNTTIINGLLVEFVHEEYLFQKLEDAIERAKKLLKQKEDHITVSARYIKNGKPVKVTKMRMNGREAL
ncbi:hypothetical protein QS257_06745 [Terrilactibacillus sp. S3-3]|nr:hypothetical protein QS257_06745 [Terrilactibacillus sp. S3-3]